MKKAFEHPESRREILRYSAAGVVSLLVAACGETISGGPDAGGAGGNGGAGGSGGSGGGGPATTGPGTTAAGPVTHASSAAGPGSQASSTAAGPGSQASSTAAG